MQCEVGGRDCLRTRVRRRQMKELNEILHWLGFGDGENPSAYLA
jgi:hypothetical protein